MDRESINHQKKISKNSEVQHNTSIVYLSPRLASSGVSGGPNPSLGLSMIFFAYLDSDIKPLSCCGPLRILRKPPPMGSGRFLFASAPGSDNYSKYKFEYIVRDFVVNFKTEFG
jgi:hypothetical protein